MTSSLLPYKTRKDEFLEIISECFGEKKQNFPLNILEILNGYLPEQCLTLPFRSFTNLTDFPKDAQPIAKCIFETTIRSIANSKYGFAFPMEPEVIETFMKRANGKDVLELGGASGEISILLALAGAASVTVNDLDEQEQKKFESKKANLPEKIQKNLEFIQGNCLNLKLNKTFDFILCRNLLHFFTDQQQAKFFSLIKSLLKPGGEVFFMVSSTYCNPNLKDVFEKNSHITRYSSVQCLVQDNSQGTMPIATIYKMMTPCEQDSDPLIYDSRYIYTRKNAGESWKAHNDTFSKFNKTIQEGLKQACAAANSYIKIIQSGGVRVLTNTLRLYNSSNFPKLFAANGFNIESTFVVDKKGHLVIDKDWYDNGRQIGIVAKIMDVQASDALPSKKQK